MNAPYRISPVVNSRIPCGLLALTTIALLCASPALGQQTQEWSWKDSGHNPRTRVDLDKIIERHTKWLQSVAGLRLSQISEIASAAPSDNPGLADLSSTSLNYVNLDDVDLRWAWFIGAHLHGALLVKANLSHARMIRAELKSAYLNNTDLSDADLSYADLSDAELFDANLSGANLTGAHLKGALLIRATLDYAHLNGPDLEDADLTGTSVAHTIFEPKSIPSDFRALAGLKGLQSLTYDTNPDALTTLRKRFKDDGFRDQERKITYAIKRRQAELAGTGILGYVEYLFNRVFFDLTCQYGMSSGRPLQLVVALWLLCSFVYLIFFIHLAKRSGLYLMPSPEFGKDEKEHATAPQRIRWQHGYSRGLRSRVLQELRLLRTAMFFSLMSAFNIGFRDINFGRWLRLLTKREYDIKAVGWARPVSGLQSLISVYFIALWVLTYFGRPFE
jgi:hypothetical protein